MLKRIAESLLNYQTWVWLVILLMASMYCSVHFPYRGEEGQYTISAIEMHYHHYYWAPLSFGAYYWRPPLFNLLIIALTNLIGWQHVLGAARIVTVTASIGMGISLWWFAHRLFQNKHYALLSVLILFTGDMLFRRSWISYADPLFSFFIFTSIALMWVGYLKNKHAFLIPAAIFLSAGFFTKGFSIYAFYGTTAIVLMFRYKENWRYFFNYKSIILHALSLIIPIIWLTHVPHTSTSGLLTDLTRPFAHIGLAAYLLKPITYPLRIIARTAPISFFVLFWVWQKKQKPISQLNTSHLKTILWVLLLCLLPYWLSAPKATHIRYIIPLYPLIAMLFAFVIWRKGENALKITLWIIVLSLIAKIITSFWGLPWFEKMTYRYPTIAGNIIKRSAGYPLYANDTGGVGLDVSSIIDVTHLPNAPLINPPYNWNNGFAINFSNDPKVGKFYTRYYTGRKHYLYLLCRGEACLKPTGHH